MLQLIMGWGWSMQGKNTFCRRNNKATAFDVPSQYHPWFSNFLVISDPLPKFVFVYLFDCV